MLSPLALALCFASAAALYRPSSDVVLLTAANFDDAVLKSPGVVMVEFYAPWCGHCKNLVPEWRKAATALKGVVAVAALDAADDANVAVASRYGVEGFPTIKVFANGIPSDYGGERTAAAFIDGGMRAARQHLGLAEPAA